VSQQWRKVAVLLLGLGLQVLLSAVSFGQSSDGTRQPGLPWASSAAEASKPVTGEPTPPIIATSKPTAPPPAEESRLPLPDDGLRPFPLAVVGAPVRVQPSTPGKLGPTMRTSVLPVGFVAPVPDHPATVQVNKPVTSVDFSNQTTGSVVPAVYKTPASPAPVVPAGSVLSLDIQGPTHASPGQMMSFQLVVRNHGTFVLAGVRVELPLSDSLRFVASTPDPVRTGDQIGWNLGNLDPGVEQRIRVDLQTRQAGEFHIRPTASYSATVGWRCQVVSPPFEVGITAPESAVRGEKVVFQIAVSNHSTEVLRRIVLRGELSSGLLHEQGQIIEAALPEDLAPGQVRTLPLEVQAAQTGRQQLVLTASADGGRQARSMAVLSVGESALTLLLRGPRLTGINEEGSYQLELLNPGKTASRPICLSLQLPEGLEYLSASHGGQHLPGTPRVTWMLSALQPGERQIQTVRLRGRQPGDWALQASVQSEGLPDARAIHAVQVEAAPTLGVELTALEDTMVVNQETQYTLRVANPGGHSARDLRVVVHMGPELLPTGADGPTRWQTRTRQAIFEPLAELNPRGDTLYRFRVRGETAGLGRLRVEVHARGLSQPIVREATVLVRGPGGIRSGQ
jgi:hypothetical protein